jgi:hypothetical protein
MSNSKQPRAGDAGTKAAAPPERRAGDRAVVVLPRAWLITGLTFLMVPWIAVAAIYLRDPAAQTEGSLQPATTGPSRPAAAGPWGHLTVTPIVVSPPLEYVAADWGRNDDGPFRWHFPGTSVEVLHAFLASTGLTADQVARLEASVRADNRIRGLTLQPDLELLRSLDSQVRARLYFQLAKSRLNADHGNSFRFFGASTDAWLGGTPISAETRQLVEPLIYRNGDIMHFADVEIVRSLVKDPEELRRLAKALLRQSTMLVRLSVDQTSEIPKLAEYWGRGGRATDVRPLLESVVGAGSDGSIDIVHLLPSFARNRLYRYPRLTTADMNKPALVNCLWTALNFFSPEPDDAFLQLDAALASLRSDYYVVESGFQLGDIAAFVDAEGDLFHVVVYLADDLVFTKNGTSPVSPWTIMPLERVKDFYRVHSEDPRLIYHRRNEF